MKSIEELLAEAARDRPVGCWATRVRQKPHGAEFMDAIELAPDNYSPKAVAEIVNREFGESISRSTVRGHIIRECTCKKNRKAPK